MKKMPPIAKIYEAFSVLADGRIKLEENKATITSSNDEKQYTVVWNENEITSNDNATVWQGYPGYPVIAVWLMKNRISYQKDIIKYFKNINWHEINKQNKRDYQKGIEDILNALKEDNIDTEKIEEEVNRIYLAIENLDFKIVRKIKN
ncbi:MAG: hypothetical protein HFI08_05345 [Bacilli bacterium]|nr:hypothetical protein [Bacilli bacterium]